MLLVACGGNTTNDSAPSCPGGLTLDNAGCTFPWPQGTKLYESFTTQSGTCGPAAPELITVMGNPETNLEGFCAGGCGTVHLDPTDAGGCQLTADITSCRFNGHTWNISENGTFNASYTMYESTLTVDALGLCSGTYSVSMVEQ
jgi:hypothetical protein